MAKIRLDYNRQLFCQIEDGGKYKICDSSDAFPSVFAYLDPLLSVFQNIPYQVGTNNYTNVQYFSIYLQCTSVGPFPVLCSNFTTSLVKFKKDKALTGTQFGVHPMKFI